ncbi:HAD family hydrolase [Vibrio cyclitrophicus]|nr:HAD-IA family hydrolase [Vibrio cyclitrophicus]UPR54089.1 HAD family hydrolase [Vibrio cyclitrophicus]
MIVFDFDGVICDSLEVCRNACQYAVGKQHSPILIETNPFRYLDPVTFETLASELGLNEPQFARDVGEFVSNNSTKTTFFYGIDAVVQQLSQSHRLFIVSASNSEAVRLQLVRHGLDSYFEDILGGDRPGSKSEKILELKRTHSTPAIMIGDCISDIKAAHESSSLSIAVTWGWQSQSYLEQAKPTAVAQNVSALTSIVHQLSDISELMA